MVAPREKDAPNWGWGTQRQLLACRVSHAVVLVVVLGMLLIIGWKPAESAGQGVATGTPASSNILLAVADDLRSVGLQAMPTAQRLATQGIMYSWSLVPSPLHGSTQTGSSPDHAAPLDAPITR